jgi:hypothetical protein
MSGLLGKRPVRTQGGGHFWRFPAEQPTQADIHSHIRPRHDTLLMLFVQLVFRAILVVRRWNY